MDKVVTDSSQLGPKRISRNTSFKWHHDSSPRRSTRHVQIQSSKFCLLNCQGILENCLYIQVHHRPHHWRGSARHPDIFLATAAAE